MIPLFWSLSQKARLTIICRQVNVSGIVLGIHTDKQDKNTEEEQEGKRYVHKCIFVKSFEIKSNVG